MDGLRYDVSPLGAGKNWVNKVGGLPDFARAIAHALIRDGHSESEAVQLAIGVLKNWASGKGNVKPETRARAAAAVARWEAMKAAAHGSRATVTEQSSAGDLLPVAPIPKPPKPRQAPHAFVGEGEKCSVCDMGPDAKIHEVAGVRTDISRHPMAVKPAISDVAQRMGQKQAFLDDADKVEPQFHATMTDLFEKQRTATLSRLNGKRGRQMLAKSGNRADPPSDDEPASNSPDPSAIFDSAFWADQTAQAAQPIYDNVAILSRAQVRGHLGKSVDNADEASSLAGVTDILQARKNKMAGDVTDTTYGQIKDTLAEGTKNGENMGQLSDRVGHVFDVARSRATTIARTETIGSLNQAAYTYADKLPPNVVGRKEWAAHHDSRTRMTHRIADKTTVPMDTPFTVGGVPMMFPGDPAAPPDEVVNCRCTLFYKPADRALTSEVAA